MKKISIMTIIALIVMSMVFLASCDTPVSPTTTPTADGDADDTSAAASAPTAINPSASSVKARAAIDLIMDKIKEKPATTNPVLPKVPTLEEQVIDLVPLVPDAGIDAADIAGVGAKITALQTRLAGLGQLVVDAATAANTVEADKGGTELVAAVAKIQALVLGPVVTPAVAATGSTAAVPAAYPAPGDATEIATVAGTIVAPANEVQEGHGNFDQQITNNLIVVLAKIRNQLLGVAAPAAATANAGTQALVTGSNAPTAGADTGIIALVEAALEAANAAMLK